MIAKKIMVFLLVFSILVVIYYILDMVKTIRIGSDKKRTWKDRVILWSSISYIVTIIFTGFCLF